VKRMSIKISGLGIVLANLLAATSIAQQQAAERILEESGRTGGLAVHLGCGDGTLTAALRIAGSGWLVQGFDASAAEIEKARTRLRAAGSYGPVTAERLESKSLPYADNLVNLIVVSGASPVTREELLRVLTPGGVAVFTGADYCVVERIVKPRPKEMDDWPMFLHGAGNNAVSSDTIIDSPTQLQWLDGPMWTRHHDRLATLSTMASAGGRVFAITDECPVALLELPPKWTLSARDAFNGLLLWQREIGPWEPFLRQFRDGPPELLRRLVATAGCVYVTLGYGQPVVALDAASGKTQQTYAGTENTAEIVLDGSTLYLVAGEIDLNVKMGFGSQPPANKRILAVDAASGEVLWKKADADTSQMQPLSLASSGGRLFFHSSRAVVCLDAASGRELWQFARKPIKLPANWRAPTLVAHEDVVLCADNNGDVRGGQAKSPKIVGDQELVALDAATGKELWKTPCAEGWHSPVDVFVIDGLVWVRENPPWGRQMQMFGRNLRTGKVERTLDTGRVYLGTFHDRCYRAKATERFILTGSLGIELTDVRENRVMRNDWARSGCSYGLMPANGLFYLSPHTCKCSSSVKLNGFYAIGPSSPGKRADVAGPALLQGPAFDRRFKETGLSQDDWATFRGTTTRAGRSSSPLPAELSLKWKSHLGGDLTQPVIADGMVYVFSKGTCTLYALGIADGTTRWTFVAGSRCDTPPTIAQGRVILGCRDGFVYCLHPDDGALVWRYRAAPEDRRIVAWGRVESAWPVHGGVLASDDAVEYIAGYNSCLDGGLRHGKLDIKTGHPISVETIYELDPATHLQPVSKDPEKGVNFSGGLRADVLAAKKVPDRLLSVKGAGMLDPSVQSRTPWATEGKQPAVSAALLVCDGQAVYGFGCHHVFRQPQPGDPDQTTIIDIYSDKTSEFEDTLPFPNRDQWRLFKCTEADESLPVTEKPPLQFGQKAPRRRTCRWSVPTEVFVRGMAVSGGRLALAGPPALDSTHLATASGFEGKGPGKLCIVSCQTGVMEAAYPLDSPPVFDGLAVAGGSVFVSLASGELQCWSPRTLQHSSRQEKTR
jgi:outer membrane protein assembly factor BamB